MKCNHDDCFTCPYKDCIDEVKLSTKDVKKTTKDRRAYMHDYYRGRSDELKAKSLANYYAHHEERKAKNRERYYRRKKERENDKHGENKSLDRQS